MPDKSKCPKCGSTSVTEIIYGQFDGNIEIVKKIAKQEVKLGGCCVREGQSPTARCRECGYAWGDEARERKERGENYCE